MTLLDDLRAHYKLDAASVVADSHGTNTLTNNNGVGTVAGKLNEAANFVAASSQSLSIASNADLSFGDEDFSISCWIRPDDVSGSVVLGKINSDFSTSYGLSFFGGTLSFSVDDGSFMDGVASWGSALSTGTWYHVVCRHNATTNIVSITVNNGTPVTTAYALGSVAGDGAFIIGENGIGGSFYDGAVDEVCVYGKYLSDEEVAALYGNGTPPAYEDFGNLPAAPAANSAGAIARRRRTFHLRRR